ncbi:hypothetical protein [Roseateles sp. LKC17W]|uniref:Type II toxin-antitoxin system PemK/MazF family toxin n=1 Tax=Pelomonas margarita TaxID=3299031 RepID=A0ABW7FNB1_9BURK
MLVFDVAEGGQRTLLLPVIVDAEMKAIGYKQPKLLLADLSNSSDLDWGQAGQLANQINDLAHVVSREVDYKRLAECVTFIQNHGRVSDAA